MRFGEYLKSVEAVSDETLTNALEVQKWRPKCVGRVLRDLGHLSQEELNSHLEQYRGCEVSKVPVAQWQEELERAVVSPEVEDWAREMEVLPLHSDGRHIQCLTDRYRDEVVESVEERLGLKCQLTVLPGDALRYLVGHVAGKKSKFKTSANLHLARPVEDRLAQPAPYVLLFKDLMDEAKRLHASDIHVTPTRDGLTVRFRVNGDMVTKKLLSAEHRLGFVNELKRLTGLSIAVSGSAQDGRASFESWRLDVRASLLPSQFGEKIVLRLLDVDRNFDLDATGFDPKTLSELKSAINRKNGLIFVSGPTGSGKSTTLYSLLCAIDRKAKNIVSLEDPIEYSIEGITQVQTGPKLSFAQALRAVLRQDPDVILVGEVRDSETADLCAKAASTGHLVLSTIHANSSADALWRAFHLGADTATLQAVARLSVAQRLVKRLCSHCSKPLQGAAAEQVREKLQEMKLSGFVEPSNLRVRSLEGCSKCALGVVGRVPVLECLTEQDMREWQRGRSSLKELTPSVTLKQTCMRLANLGEVDVYDALEIE